ncbi:MAG: SDR family NAD(P)-dependent oxidoreductase, partial [Kordiimonadaceae bacterium]|nr:SDR family NAD(P)-dependent oxidoreductase [Kordiimonadaceae bacterium]
MKNLEEQVILVTGATDGIGKGVANKLAQLGARVLLHGRDAGRLAKVRENIIRETKNEKIETYLADFSALEEVRKFASKVHTDHESLDVLINNAGIGRGRRGHQNREVSADGFELRFQVNHLAPFLLAHLLLPLLRAGSPSRIINVASASQDKINFDDIMLERSYNGTRAYSQSKLAMVMSTFELAKRLESSEVTVN